MQKVIYFIFILLITSCSTDPVKEDKKYTEDQIQQKKRAIGEVMEVHDEAMAWMDQIQQLKSLLKDVDMSAETDSTKEVYSKAVTLLEEADESMMGWMRNYSAPNDSVKFNDVMQYLEGQRELINQVRGQMKESMDNAKALTKQK